MIAFNWTAAALGFACGAGMSVLFFAGLGLGMRLALRTNSPIRILSLSAVLRIAALLAVGWLVAAQGGPWAFAGYGLAFFLIRTVFTSLARLAPASPPPPPADAEQPRMPTNKVTGETP